MPPHEGLVHPKEYDIKDSNVELVGSDLDHKVKYNSAATEPAWNNGQIGQTPGLWVWRIEDFEVVPWPKEKYGQFYNGDSYIILHTAKVGKDGDEKLIHDIFFWLGAKTSQDEAGTAAYKTVELDEFLHGAATQHRELQSQVSDEFVSLFPRITILKGGVKSGFRHVEEEPSKEVTTLLRIFKHPAARKSDSIMVVEVEPHWQSLDEEDVFVLDKGSKIWVWQGKKASPMEKAKAAQVVGDLTLAKHIDVEVLTQTEPRSHIIISMLGGGSSSSSGGGGTQEAASNNLRSSRPILSSSSKREDSIGAGSRGKRLFRLSDADGPLSVDFVKAGDGISTRDLESDDVFLYDTGTVLWVWEGSGASRQEKAKWMKVAQSYIRHLQNSEDGGQLQNAHLVPVAKVAEGHESPTFLRAFG